MENRQRPLLNLQAHRRKRAKGRMEKIAALKRRLIKEGAILGGALIGLIIIYFVFVFRLSSIQDDIDRVKRETIAINKEKIGESIGYLLA